MSEDKPPAWLDQAWRLLGVAEVRGKSSHPDIVALYRDSGHPAVRNDEVAWCAAFVGAALARAGIPPSGSLLARSYLDHGTAIDVPRHGAVAVFSRGSDPSLGHVGFLVGHVDDDLIVLGGNQADAVTVAAYPRSRLLGLRWPFSNDAMPQRSLFDRALDHVLVMEGGWTDDPHDPGGPTNLGITLAVYAAWRRIEVTPDTFGALKTELRRIDRASATAIYRARYWNASQAEDMPPALALFHFDASVNHGVTGAARLLQQALGVAIDGEIGDTTLAAARRMPVADLIARYAEARITKYRSLPHFWRFGRGWLNRVSKTRAAALALIEAPASPPSSSPMKDPTMTTLPTEPAQKWWGNSLTIWGTLLTALTTVLPALGPLFGIDLTGDMIVNLGHSITALVQAIGGVAGTFMAIWGRVRATQPLMRRDLSLRL